MTTNKYHRAAKDITIGDGDGNDAGANWFDGIQVDPPTYSAPVTTMTSSVGSDSDSTSSISTTSLTHSSIAASGFVINVSYDTSVTNLAATNPALEADFKSAVQTAVKFYENEIANSITVNINFGWGEFGGTPVTGLSMNQATVFNYNYNQVYAGLKATDTTSTVQQTAVATLPVADPSGGGTVAVTSAEGLALGLNLFFTGTDGSVGLNSSDSYTWTGGSIAANTFDAVGALEHEISEVLGRISTLGAGNRYMPLDFFRYTAADDGANDPPGSAAGTRDEPFVAGYNSNTQAYFSYDAETITLPFDTPAHVAAGADSGDWSDTVANDSYGYASPGASLPVSATDLNVMNVLGYDLKTQIACFAAGTRVATVDGEVPVENLSAGASVRSVFGGSVCVTWVGRRRIDCSRHPAPELVWPVLIAAGAFEAGQPRRDLYLSPDHAVYLRGALVPIKLLINRTTIRQVEVPTVTYYHVEVARHDIVLAEGLPAETYLDTGNRSAFENGGAAIALYPDFGSAQKARVTGSRVPLLVEPDAVEPVWRALADRAEGQGWRVPSPALVDAPKLRLRIGNQYRKPAIVRGDHYLFVMGAEREPAFLVSHAARPCDLWPWVDDLSQLGVMVRRLTVRSNAQHRDVALDDPSLDRGWWDVEWHGGQPVRWTTGEAKLPELGAGLIEVELSGAMKHAKGAGNDQVSSTTRDGLISL